MELLSPEQYGYSFVSGEYLPSGKDEYWLRNRQAASLLGASFLDTARPLTAKEIAVLESNGCRSGGWDSVLVSDPFDPALIWNSSFYGLVRIGALEKFFLKHHDFCVPAGIRNSTIISCDIGCNVSIQDCSLISHYIVADRCIFSRIDEMVTTAHAKFGNGIIKEGEDESVRVWIDVMNESGGRSILPFAGMIPADALLWAAYRDDTALTEKLKTITQETCGGIEGVAPRSRGFYGTIGTGAVIKSCRIIKDLAVGEYAYIKGANKLKNLTVLSSEDEPSQIGEGVEMVNGIAGYGSHIFYGAKAVRFILGNRCNLKYGARLIHSVLGDNSTVSCCEILNNLVFPVHEQHHNNSFLVASLVEGMSNLAAGATVGSNHNSRANDGEIRAGRGFWPGLSVTLKHSSRFASFCLIAKGDYPYELNVPLPFTLINNNVHQNRLELMPAYFWMYNLYALERNSWKTASRDKRKVKVQRIETDYLAPDTAEEMIAALRLMERWMRDAGMISGYSLIIDMEKDAPFPARAEAGRGDEELDPEYDYSLPDEEILNVRGLERHSRSAIILKPRRAMDAYREMLFFYGMKTIIAYFDSRPGMDFAAFLGAMAFSGAEDRDAAWVNLGGQIVPARKVDKLREDIRGGKLASWEAVHGRYDEMAAEYEEDRARHAWSVLALPEAGAPGGAVHPLAEKAVFASALDQAAALAEKVAAHVYRSRAKDFHDPFRAVTYRNREEMEQVVGRAEDDAFVRLTEENYRAFTERARRVRGRL